MKRVNQKFNKLFQLQTQVDKITEEITKALCEHIGEDYFLSYDRGDGWLVVCGETSNQSRVGWGFDLDEIFKMTPEEAKQAIDDAGFN